MGLQTGDESYILSSGLNCIQINQIKHPRKGYLRPKAKDGAICHLLLNRPCIVKQGYF